MNGIYPKVSIVVPVCNVEKYVGECLESLIEQSLHDIEIICINDGSKDESLAILREFERKDSRIKVVDKPNAGYGHTMNIGMRVAKGEYIGIVESDDRVDKVMYERLYNCAHKYDLDWVKADFFRYTHDENNKVCLKRINLCPNQKYYNKVFKPNDVPECYDFTMHTWCGIYKRAFLENYGIRHNETPGASFQDTGFFFQTFMYAKRAYFLNDVFYWYRCDNPNSSVKNKSKVYCIKDEYEFVEDLIAHSKEKLPKNVKKMMWVVRCGSYLRTYKRIAPEFKKEFLAHFRNVFLEAKQKGELDMKLLPASRAESLNMILNQPKRFYFFDKVYAGREGKKLGKFAALNVLIHRFIWSVRDHGMKHALKRGLEMLKNGLKAPSWSYRSAVRAHLCILGRKFLRFMHIPNGPMKEIKKFKNIHAGQRCFITCTGPSLQIDDLEKLEKEFTIGVNTIFLAFRNTNWRPTYYAIVDAYIAQKYENDYDMDFEKFCTREVFLNSYVKAKKSKRIHKCHIDFINHTKYNLKNNKLHIDEDIATHIIDCFTVTNMAISIAIYMGFSEIYIIGADCNFEGEKLHFTPNQFDPVGAKKGRLGLNVARSISGYMAMKHFADKKGVRIFNATRGGHLEVFERVNFDDLFRQKSDLPKPKYSEFFENIKAKSNGREILLWGRDVEFINKFKEFFGYNIRNFFFTKSLTNGVKTVYLPDLKNQSDKYYLVCVDTPPAQSKVKLLENNGYYEKDFQFFKHMPTLVKIDNYSDEYGNRLKNCPQGCTVEFKGNNATIVFGRGVKVFNTLKIVVESNVNIIIKNNVVIGGLIDAKEYSSLAVYDNCNFIGDTKILVSSNCEVIIRENTTSGSGLDIKCHPGYRIYIGKDCMFSQDIHLISGPGHSTFDLKSKKKLYLPDELSIKQKSIYIGAHVWIGYGVTVINGAEIGTGSIIGANSLIKKYLPNNCQTVGQSQIIKRDVCWARNPYEDNQNTIFQEYRISTENKPNIRIEK